IRTLGLSLAVLLAALVPAAAPAHADTSPTHAVSVSGHGVSMYPAFSQDVERYAVTTTTAATGGVLDVTAGSSAPDGTVLVDGRPAHAPVHLTGLVELDDQFQEVRRFRTSGLVDTDLHDSILDADGHR